MSDRKVDEAKGPAEVAASGSASDAKSPAKEALGSDDTSPESSGPANQPGPSLMEKVEHAVRTVKERFTGAGK